MELADYQHLRPGTLLKVTDERALGQALMFDDITKTWEPTSYHFFQLGDIVLYLRWMENINRPYMIVLCKERVFRVFCYFLDPV